jgi:hypothetical protein
MLTQISVCYWLWEIVPKNIPSVGFQEIIQQWFTAL